MRTKKKTLGNSSRIYSRSKRKFSSARAAWHDIGKSTGLRPDQVKSAGHTGTLWRWSRR